MPLVRVVPVGKVKVIVLPEVMAVIGANVENVVLFAPTKVPTVLPEGPKEREVMVAAKAEEIATKKKKQKIRREKKVFTKKFSGGFLLSLSLSLSRWHHQFL